MHVTRSDTRDQIRYTWPDQIHVTQIRYTWPDQIHVTQIRYTWPDQIHVTQIRYTWPDQICILFWGWNFSSILISISTAFENFSIWGTTMFDPLIYRYPSWVPNRFSTEKENRFAKIFAFRSPRKIVRIFCFFASVCFANKMGKFGKIYKENAKFLRKFIKKYKIKLQHLIKSEVSSYKC